MLSGLNIALCVLATDPAEMFSSFSPSAKAHRLVIHHRLNLTIRPVEHTIPTWPTTKTAEAVTEEESPFWLELLFSPAPLGVACIGGLQGGNTLAPPQLLASNRFNPSIVRHLAAQSAVREEPRRGETDHAPAN